MKRLIRRAGMITLYHATTFENLKGITESGKIVPQNNEGFGLGQDNDNFISDQAYDEVKSMGIDDSDPNFEDEFSKAYNKYHTQMSTKLNGFSFFTTTKERAEETYLRGFRIEAIIEISVSEDALLPDDNDDPDATTWQESRNSVQQVKVLGEINTTDINGVYIYDYGDEVGFFPKLTWKEDYKEKE